MVRASQRAVTTWTRIGFVALCGVLGVGCLSETRYVCPPGSDVTASVRCGAACASGELSAEECVLVEAACADGRLSAVDCEGLGGDMGVRDMGDEDAGDTGPDGDVVTEVGVDAGPCGMDCVGPEPHCNMTSGECVECLSMSDCGGSTPQCNAEGECVECLNSTQCTADVGEPVCFEGACVQCDDATDCDATNPVCETPAQVCGGCTNRTQCLGYAALPSCNLSTGACVACDEPNESSDCNSPPGTPNCNASRQCVQCTQNTDCTNFASSRCTMGQTCAPCVVNSDCSHVTEGRNRCDAGQCVDCTVATEDADCGVKSCNPATRTCSTIDQNSRGVCEPCVADSDCTQMGGTFRCIAMNYMGAPRGGYCMRATPGCQRPFLTPIMQPSLSGAAMTTYCGIDQTVVSCEAVNALRTGIQCPGGNDSECMAEGALCEMVGLSDNRCTYECGTTDDCPAVGSASTCGGGYCGS